MVTMARYALGKPTVTKPLRMRALLEEAELFLVATAASAPDGRRVGWSGGVCAVAPGT